MGALGGEAGSSAAGRKGGSQQQEVVTAGFKSNSRTYFNFPCGKKCCASVT